MIHRFVTSLSCLIVFLFHPAVAQNAYRPSENAKNGVLLVGNQSSLGEAFVLQSFIFLPQPADYDIPSLLVESLDQDVNISDYQVILFLSQSSSIKKPGPEVLEELKNLVTRGGLVIFFGESLPKLFGSGNNLGDIASLVGATTVTRGDEARPTEDALKLSPELGKKQRPWMSGGYALTNITTGKALLGTEEKASAMVNTVGKGKVVFLGAPITAARPDTGIEAYVELIRNLILETDVTRDKTTRENWALIPLGQDKPPAPDVDAPKKKALISKRQVSTVEGKPTQLVKDGIPVAKIVLSQSPTPAARQASLELQKAILQITDANLEVVSDDQVEEVAGQLKIKGDSQEKVSSLIFVGGTKWSRNLGIDEGKIPWEGFTHRSANGIVVIVGGDRRENGLEMYGTLYGVFDFLEAQFGMRWLWPGPIGTVHPRLSELAAQPLIVFDAPLLAVRKLRNISITGPAYHEPYRPEFWNASSMLETYAANPKSNLVGRIRRGLKLLGRNEEDYVKKYAAASPWFASARTGMNQRIYGTHAFDDWYEKHYQEHREWFALQPSGTREQNPVRPRLNKVDPGLIAAVAKQTVEKFAQDPLLDAAPFSPNDGSTNSWDMSEASRKLDPPNGDKILLLHQIGGFKFSKPYVALSDRMVIFNNAVAAEVQKLRPGSRIGTGAYSYYRTPPLHQTLDPSVVLFYTGLNYLNDSNLKKDRQNWNGWAGKANELILRPNAFHAGHGFPVVWVRKMAADVKKCYETGMIGADWDAIIHHWATVGLNYYVLSRLLWDPSQSVDAIVKDYCDAGFGPAARSIEAYFADLESLTNDMAKSVGEATETALREEEEIDVNSFAREVVQRLSPQFYTPERITRLRAYFTEARKLAVESPAVLARLDFLELGIDYAEIQTEVYRFATQENPDKEKLGNLLTERQEFFGELFDEHPMAVNLPYIAWREEVLYKKFHPATGQTNSGAE